jgi:hypothetical protein
MPFMMRFQSPPRADSLNHTPVPHVNNLPSELIGGKVARLSSPYGLCYLIAFIAHQYYRLHDNLVDVLLTSVKTFENATFREHRNWCFDERKLLWCTDARERSTALVP